MSKLLRTVLIVVICLPLRAEWQALGPFGGPAALVWTDMMSPGTVIAGTSTALLFRSEDGGDTWVSLPFPLQLRAVLHTFVIHPKIRSLYFAGVAADKPGTSGLWRSADAGATWHPVADFQNLQVRALAIFRGDSRVMAAGTDTGVFRTTDGGLTWSRISPAQHLDLQPVVSVTFDARSSETIYAGTPHLPWKTIDGGRSWRSIHAGMIDDSDIFSIVVHRHHPQRVFAGACSGVYRSLNGGDTWEKLPGSKDASFRTYTLVQDPQHENVLVAGTTLGMIRSRDGGSTWQKITGYATRSIAFDYSRLGRIFIATDEAGLLRSDDNGQTWEPINQGFCNRRLSPLAAGAAGEIYSSAGGGATHDEFFMLPPGSREWLARPFLRKPLLTMTPSSTAAGTVYAATSRSLLVTADAGRSWVRLPKPDSGDPVKELLAPPWTPETILTTTGDQMFVSPDLGISWKDARVPGAIRSVIPLDPPWIAALTQSEVFLSRDGEKWQRRPHPPGAGDVLGLVTSGQRLIAATTRGLRVSDQGRSWQPVSGPLEGSTVQAICKNPALPSNLYAASYQTIFEGTDGGRSWRKISPDQWPVQSVKQLMVRPGTPGRLLVLTQQQGVFELILQR
jgi:photosystem II stability/assembly factor-like uncharacterized protein